MSVEEPPYAALTEFFQFCERRSFTMSFSEIETILGAKLPWEASKYQIFWRETSVDMGKRSFMGAGGLSDPCGRIVPA